MPNTIAHFGVQGIVTTSLIRDADPRWVFLGCIVPDMPWILYRAVKTLGPKLNLYDLRLYAMVQASLMFCLILCLAFALLSLRPRKVFLILALNSGLHLLLDACQTKWANGVHLFAPFSWQLMNFGFFWPESLPTILITAFGFIYVTSKWRFRSGKTIRIRLPHARRLLLVLASFVTFFSLPLVFLSAAQAPDNHSIKTLRHRNLRAGKQVSFDRAFYLRRDEGDVLLTFAGEELLVKGNNLAATGTVSARATFQDDKTIFINKLHAHWGRARDILSYIGLLLLIVFCLI